METSSWTLFELRMKAVVQASFMFCVTDGMVLVFRA